MGEFESRLKILNKDLLTLLKLPGSHHLHLDPETAPQCAEVIKSYLK